MSIITYHAKERALERYGVKLAEEQAAALIALCKSGRAPCMRSDHMGRIHVGALDGKIFVFALHPEADRIVTFLPPDYFNRGSRVAHKHETGRWKQRGKPHIAAMNPTYSRAALKRQALDLEEDEA